MAVFIHGGTVNTSSGSSNTGVFIGQNIQSGWDSFSPQKVVSGYSMGDFSDTSCYASVYWGWAHNFQPVYDEDMKGNWRPNVMI